MTGKYTDGGDIDLDDEEIVSAKTGMRITNADADKLADWAERVGPGRPALTRGSTGPSPRVAYRVPQATKAKLAEVAARENRRESEVARAALDEYLERHSA